MLLEATINRHESVGHICEWIIVLCHIALKSSVGYRLRTIVNCENGAEENQITWSIERPDETYCQFCGMRYPGEKYPETGVLRVKNPLGQIQEYPYWEAPDPPPTPLPNSLSVFDPKRGYRYFFRAKGWQVAQDYFINAARDLAQLYFLTNDQSYAHRSALILKRFAEVYPGYCVSYDMPFQQQVIFPGDHGFPYPVSDYRAAKLSFWTYSDIPTNLILAYDLIRNSGELDNKAKQRIEEDLSRLGEDTLRRNGRSTGGSRSPKNGAAA